MGQIIAEKMIPTSTPITSLMQAQWPHNMTKENLKYTTNSKTSYYIKTDQPDNKPRLPLTTPTSTLDMLPATPSITHIAEHNHKRPMVSPRAPAPEIPLVERTNGGCKPPIPGTTTTQTDTNTSLTNTTQTSQTPPIPTEPQNNPTLSITYGKTLILNNDATHIRFYGININGISVSENYADG